jgi:gluconokinase
VTRAAVLSIDIGSSSVRAGLFDGGADPVPGTASHRGHRFTNVEGGGSTADADCLLDLVISCIDETIAAAPDGTPVAAAGLCTFLHGLLGADGDCRAVTPVLTWADSRSQPQADRLSSLLDAEEVRQRTGCPLHPVYYPAKIAWLREESGDLFHRVRWWCSIGEYCLRRLTGTTACSLSMAAGTGLLDREAGAWDRRLLEAIQVDAAALSPLAVPGRPLVLQAPFAARWPLLRHAAWMPPLGDNACSSVGCGADAPGQAALMIGTTGALRLVRESRLLDHRQPVPAGLWAYRMDSARELVGGVLGDGGSLFEWLLSSLHTGTPPEELDAELLSAPAAAHGLTVLPFLTGERSTGWNPKARGAVIGIGPGTRSMEILQAGLEAVAYRFAAILKRVRTIQPAIPEVIGTGGALRASAAWGQILSDVLEVPLLISDAAEASSRGAAILALRARGIEPEARFRVLRKLTPRASAAAAHRAAFQEQERLLAAVYPAAASKER